MNALGPHSSTPAELQARLRAEREGAAFLVCRDPSGRQRLFVLPEDAARVTVGRAPQTDVTLDWDTEVSRLHAQLEQVAGEWVVFDDGLSRNGTYLNGERVHGRRRLADGDELRFGGTVGVYRDPENTASEATTVPVTKPQIELSPTQQSVLLALCRPLLEAGRITTPATNEEIAREAFLGVSAVKAHLRTLYRKFAIGHLAQNAKRARLAELAIEYDAVRLPNGG
jgi:pSer/pThr/pTyr-binding forkhead associated (FHA) protein